MSEDLKKSPEEWVEHYQSHYIATLTAEIASRIIKNDMTNVARSCISIGFHLKAVRDRELFREMGYDSLWNYAADQFGLSMSSASRYIAINDQFSVGGNTPQLQPEYRNFSKSQLQEMLNMSPEQIGQVKEDMTVKEIRKLKKPETVEPEEEKLEENIPGQMEIKDFPEVLPEEDPVATSQKQEERNEDSFCPPGIQQCIRQEWGTSKEEQHAGQKECAKCWGGWKERKSILETVEKEKKPLSVYSLPLREDPEDSLIARPGCGTHDCFMCHQGGCDIRQEFCYCVEAPRGNPFPCEMLDKVPELQKEKPENCQFLDDSLAYHREGDGEAVPCCKDCENLCTFACGRTKKALEKMGLPAPGQPARENLEEDDDELLCDDCRNASVLTGDPDLCANCSDGRSYEPFPEEKQGLSDMDLLRSMLREENDQLSEYLKVDKVEKLPEDMIRRKKILVCALAAMKCDLENTEQERSEQPELPLMKNNDQRKAFLETYHDWPIWFEVPQAAEVYYRYDLPDGVSLVICEYHYWLAWKARYREDAECTGTREYLLAPGYHYLEDCKSNRTSMIETLKEVQKNGEK